MKSMVTLLIKRSPFILAGLMLCVSTQSATVNHRNGDLRPTGKGYGEALPSSTGSPGMSILLDDNELYGANSNAKVSNRATPNSPTTGYGINYHGGPLITTTPNIYYIWYGSWTNNTAPAILNNLAQFIGGSSRYNINSTYYDASNVSVLNDVAFKGSMSVAYPYGKTLTDAKILAVVNDAVNSNSRALPIDENGIYFVLTSKDVKESSGFGTQYCGWHSYATISGANIKYAFVGDPSVIAPRGCEAQSISPNGNPGADGMASVIVHELEEAVTDPNFTGWYDIKGYENSDKCAWTFGTLNRLSTRAYYNMTLGSLKYLIQQNWVNVSPAGYCAKSY